MPIAFDTKAPLDRIIAVLEASDMVTAGLQKVYRGVPESLAFQVSAYVFIGAMERVDKAAGLLQLSVDYYLTFGYRVSGAEATAENVLSAVLDKFIEVFYTTERPARLNGTCQTCELDFSRVTRAYPGAYDQVAGQEFRLYPLVVSAVLQSSIP